MLVSAELGGRNLYSGDHLSSRIYVVNDKVDGEALKPSVLDWQIVNADNHILAAGKENFPEVTHYGMN